MENTVIHPQAPASTATATAPSDTAEKKMRVIIGLPNVGGYSQQFLLAWTESLHVLIGTGRYEIVVSPASSSHVGLCRLKTLGVDNLRGKNQKPFNGQAYDVYLTLDSDVIFSPAQLIELIESTRLHPVVCGSYMMADGKHLAVVKDWDKEYFLKNGTFQFLQAQDLEPYMAKFKAEIEQRRTLIERKEEPGPLSSPEFMKVSYAGMGFFACRKEVLDSLQYPYFHRELQRMRTKDGLELVDMCSEDVAFCKNVEDAGFDIMLNTRLRVGHEKPVVL